MYPARGTSASQSRRESGQPLSSWFSCPSVHCRLPSGQEHYAELCVQALSSGPVGSSMRPSCSLHTIVALCGVPRVPWPPFFPLNTDGSGRGRSGRPPPRRLKRSCYVARTSLKLVIPLLNSSERWGDKQAPHAWLPQL